MNYFFKFLLPKIIDKFKKGDFRKCKKCCWCNKETDKSFILKDLLVSWCIHISCCYKNFNYF